MIETIENPRRIVVCLLLYVVFATWAGPSWGQEGAIEGFLQERVPSLLEIMQRLEQQGEREDFEEAMEWANEIHNGYRDADEETGEEWADLHVALAENEAAMRLLRWKAASQ